MKKLFKTILLALVLLITCSLGITGVGSVVTTSNASNNSKINIYLFWGIGCTHCKNEIKFLDKMKIKYPNIEIHKYEVTKNEENFELMKKIKKQFSVTRPGYPYTAIGGKSFYGFSRTIERALEDSIIQYTKNPAPDIVNKIMNDLYDFKIDSSESLVDPVIEIPLVGQVNLKDFSIPIIAIILGTLDGFNPCAMWVLLLLISVLLDMKSNKRRWVLGLTFLVTSALIYFGFMMAWLQVSMSLSQFILLRNVIALAVVSFGLWNIYSFLKNLKQDTGCDVTDANQKRKIFIKIKEFTMQKSFFLSIIGIMTLAISVNFIELVCSAGLPLLFSEILTINEVKSLATFMYSLLYILCYLLDDIIIFSIAMISLKVTSLSTRYSKYSNVIGGILMLIIGILLVFNPGWLMFSF